MIQDFEFFLSFLWTFEIVELIKTFFFLFMII